MRRQLITRRQKDISRLIRQRRKTHRAKLKAMLIHGMIIQGNSEGDHYGPVSIGSPDERVEKQCKTLGQRVARLVKSLK